MKLLLTTGVLGALAAGLFLLPIGGRTLWQRAEARGYPQSATRAMSRGAHAAVRWAESKEPRPAPPEGMPGHKAPPRRDVARAAPPNPHGAPAREPGLSNEPAPPAHAARELPAPRPPLEPRAPPAPAHDHILAAPPQEQLTARDRQGLDQLIAGAGHPSR